MASEPITLTYLTVDVFTSTRYLGNPLAVVLIPSSLRPRLTQDVKQRIAREFNFSETVFLHTLDDEARDGLAVTSRDIDIFTIEEELPFAGHPTVGTAYLVLNHLGWKHVDTLVTKAGPIAIEPLEGEGGRVKATIPHAVHVHRQTLGGLLGSGGGVKAETRDLIQASLSDDAEIREAELNGPVVSIVRGMTFLLAKLPSLEHLAKVSTAKRLDFNKVGGLLDKGEWEGGFVCRYYYVPTEEERRDEKSGRKEFKFRTRMVELGFEDPATGSAACTLASYLTVSGREVGGARFELTQGVEMGRQSEIEVETTAVEEEGGEVKVKDLYLGGTAVVVTKGEMYVPEEPVVSKKTGAVFEKRLIEKYIQENHKEPGTDEELDVEDLLPIKTNRIVRPRPPQFTSIPSMLKAFQDEWDALVLESYNTRQQLARTREELATALYQNDAAVRVIARLTKERDEAREALSRLTVTASAGGAATRGDDAMAVDSEGLPEALAAHVDQVQAEKQKGRKKRPVPEGWATPEDVSALQQTAYTDLPVTQATSLALNAGYAAVGGLDGKVDLYSVEAKAHERSLEIGEPVTATVWISNKVVSATSRGSVKAVEGGVETGSVTEHAGVVTGLAVHPGEQILASVGVDKGIIFYDLQSLQRVARVYTDAELTSCAFHPDGHLFAAGTQSGLIEIFDTKTLQRMANFTLGAPVKTLVFSENGFWFAATGVGQSSVTVFDLRKEGDAARAKELQTGDVSGLAWDYTGQYLVTAGSQGVTVQQYVKASKSWTEPLRTSTPAVAVQWGDKARQLVAVSREGVVSVLEPQQSE
ncbi:Diaminopimelate epimerase-like protein [Pseudoneurospora amorphoporcata]|uniref:Pre-mRNA-processing factor 19 n=1 Tax=Pseudoneurospora amorphoporcata TaxID=241081 RepID=A0AAN6NYQ9_9PEZI|nr:Diaminopimelate epimerase-like protein [Pseudoneurospora amorphoporcata]